MLEERRAVERRQERTLMALAAVLSLVLVAMSLTPEQTRGARPFDAIAAAALFGAYAPLALARRFPLAVLVSTMAATSVWFPLGYAGALPAPALLAAIFVITSIGRRAQTLVALGVIVLPMTAVSLLASDVQSLTVTAGILGWMAAAALLGDVIHKRRQLEDEYERRSASAAAEQNAETERRVAEERLRISRDLHDVLAHTITAMSVQAAVASDAVAFNPEAASAALDRLRQQAAHSVEQVRASIGSLRAGEAGIDPVPGLRGLGGLLQQSERSGLRVELRELRRDVSPLPDLVDVCAYRIIQEALTNVQRHSLATSAVITLSGDTDTICLTVADPGPRRFPVRPGGFGLIGMRERATAAGGAVDLGSTDEGGFEVRAVLPLVREYR